MKDPKVKFYKNNQRSESDIDVSKFSPQYQSLGIEPEEHKSPVLMGNIKISPGNKDNPRIKQNLPLEKKVIVPNIGNNIENSWSSIDNVVDDLDHNYSIDQVIDNNDYLPDYAFGNSDPGQHLIAAQDSDVNLLSAIEKSSFDDYILIVDGIPFCSGNQNQIEEQASLLIFGEHEYSDGNPISPESLIILKKYNIKIGLTIK